MFLWLIIIGFVLLLLFDVLSVKSSWFPAVITSDYMISHLEQKALRGFCLIFMSLFMCIFDSMLKLP